MCMFLLKIIPDTPPRICRLQADGQNKTEAINLVEVEAKII